MQLQVFFLLFVHVRTAQGVAFAAYVSQFRLTIPYLLVAACRLKLSVPCTLTVLRSCGKRCSETPLVHVSVDCDKKYDPGNVATDRSLIRLVNVMGRYACSISFSACFHDRDFLAGVILFLKTAHISRRCVTAQWFTFGFACSIFRAPLLQISDFYNKFFRCICRVHYKGV